MSLRITTVLDDKINNFCEKLTLTRSTFVYKAIMHYLIGKDYKDLERLNRQELARSQSKEDNFSLYLCSNA